jgi:voltage-gated potassium channel
VTGALLYHWLEGWSMLDSLYFVIITLTTIGYGDFSPTMPITKLLTIFYGLNGAAILLMLFDEIRRLRRHKLAETVDQLRTQNGDETDDV